MHYLGMATQLIAGIGIPMFIGYWIDKKISTSTQIFIWLLPLIYIVYYLYYIIKATSKRK
jgi:F0F1-type ATP synthase assembly protein I